MKTREVASIAVFLYVVISFIAVNHNNQLENERLEQERQTVEQTVS